MVGFARCDGPVCRLIRPRICNIARAACAGNLEIRPRGMPRVKIPREIDDHYRMYGKEPWEVEYGEKCGLCESRIDEYGMCSCGSSGE